MTKILVVEARFYNDISDLLLDGTIDELKKYKIEYEIATVNGALEIPAIVNFAYTHGEYAGFICLGCVIRGETTHYDYVCQESCRGIMDLSLKNKIAITNGILTVENKQQAITRADKKQKNKGGYVAKSCLEMINFKKYFESVNCNFMHKDQIEFSKELRKKCRIN